MKKMKFLYVLLGLALVLTGCDDGSNSNSNTSSSSGSSTPSFVTGSGTEDDPYVLYTAQHLRDLADEVNSDSYAPTEIEYFQLGNDIDLANEEWIPIGNSLEQPFSGYFDGNGYTISNLKITQLTEENKNLGFFGVLGGYVKDLKLENVTIDVENPTNLTEYPAIGGLAGVSYISVFEGIEVTGTISYTDEGYVEEGTRYYDQAYIGGLVGLGAVADNYYVDAGYCMTDVDIDAPAPTTIAGGLIGYYTTSGPTGIFHLHDSYAVGDIKAGAFAGGLIGHMDYWVSIANSYATSNIEMTSTDGAIAGGLVGRGYYDTAIQNSFATGSVQALNSTSYVYESYVGSLVGYGPKGGLEEYTLSEGTLVLNSYGVENGLLEGDNLSDLGLETNQANLQTASWLRENLHWDENYWNIADGQYPTLKEFSEIEKVEQTTVTVTLDPNYENAVTQTVEVEKGDYDPLPILEATVERAPYIFDQWYYDKECTMPYCAYLPILEDTTLYANWRDYRIVEGVYRGESEYNGTLVVSDDGTFIWIHYDGQYVPGVYEFIDNQYFVFENENYPLTLGTYEDGVLEFPDANDDSYVYTFTKVDAMYGDWVDDNNSILHFDGKGNGYYDDGSEHAFTYSLQEDAVAITFTSYFAYELTVTIQEDGTLNVHFDDGYGEDVFDKTFTKKPLIPDYTGKPFIGKYYSSWGYMDLFTDGQGEYNNGDYTVPGGYVIQNDGVTFNISFSGNSGQVKYNETQDVFYGNFKGSKVVFARSEYVTSYSTADGNVLLSVHEDGQYLVKNNALETFTLNGTLADGEIIYIIINDTTYTYRIEGNTLVALGNEYGTFTNGDDTLTFDGIGGATYKDETVTYLIDDTKVLVYLSDGSYLGFTLDYQQKTFTTTAQDSFFGVYYDKTSSDTKDYKLDVTGYGFAILYEADKGTDTWTKVNDGKCSVSGTTLSVTFGSAYSLAISEENNVLSGTISGTRYTFLKDGYVPDEPGTGDAYQGTWTKTDSEDIVFTFDGNGNGTFNNGAGISFEFTYEVTGDGIEFTSQTDDSVFVFYSATINDENQLVVSLEQDFETYSWTFNLKPEEAKDAYAGTWEQTTVSGNILTIDGQGNGSFNNGTVVVTFTYEVTEDGLTVTSQDSYDYFTFYSATINGSGQLVLELEQDYESYTWTFAK